MLYDPLNYYGVSILACIAKLHGSIFNNRLSKCCDLLNIVSRWTKWFSLREIIYIYTLTSIIYNVINIKLPTYCDFIDFQKAFDCISRIMLLCKILRYNIDKKMF